MNNGILYFPESVKSETVFNAIGSGSASAVGKNWQQWQKPKGCQFVSIFAVGAGGGGGIGFSGIAGSARGGGGGGGSGGIARAIYLASMLPDTLWIQVPRGGESATNGGRAFVCTCQGFSARDFILTSGNADAGRGSNGTISAGGAAGAASTVAVITLGIAGLALSFVAQAGYVGIVGGSHTGANGGDITPTGLVCGGASGAGTTSANFAGGNIVAAGAYQYATPQVTGGAAGTNNGNHGYRFFNNFFLHTGGAGGGSNNTAAGGAGGNGGIGCGGGGGGGGTTGGAGGRGGDGIVIIATW